MQAEPDPPLLAPASPLLSVLPDLPMNLGVCTEQQAPWTLSEGARGALEASTWWRRKAAQAEGGWHKGLEETEESGDVSPGTRRRSMRFPTGDAEPLQGPGLRRAMSRCDVSRLEMLRSHLRQWRWDGEK